MTFSKMLKLTDLPITKRESIIIIFCVVTLLLSSVVCTLSRSFQNKALLKFFLFLSNKCQKIGNTKTGTEIINPCITALSFHLKFRPYLQNFLRKISEHANLKFKIFLNQHNFNFLVMLCGGS